MCCIKQRPRGGGKSDFLNSRLGSEFCCRFASPLGFRFLLERHIGFVFQRKKKNSGNQKGEEEYRGKVRTQLSCERGATLTFSRGFLWEVEVIKRGVRTKEKRRKGKSKSVSRTLLLGAAGWFVEH